MTVRRILRTVTENLARAGVKQPPNADELLGLVNRAKDEVVKRFELLDEDPLTQRATFNVVAGDASVTLPSDFRRLIQLRRTDGGRDLPVTVVDVRERDVDDRVHMWPEGAELLDGVYIENGKLWFPGVNGAAAAMTLRLHYRYRVGDATQLAASLDAEFEGFPGEYAALIADKASADALAVGPERDRYLGNYLAGCELMQRAASERVLDGPKRVRMRNYPWAV